LSNSERLSNLTLPKYRGTALGLSHPYCPPPRKGRKHPARRWVVERTNSWHNRFRALKIRWEKKSENYEALVQFACAIITTRFLG
jgi:hypothetical protein